MGPTRTRSFGAAEPDDEEPAPTFDLIGDTLAYPNVVSLRGRALQTDRGTVRFGDSMEEVAALFPISAACSAEQTGDWFYRDQGGFDDFIAVADTTRRARAALFFRGGRVAAISVLGYVGWDRAQWQASD